MLFYQICHNVWVSLLLKGHNRFHFVLFLGCLQLLSSELMMPCPYSGFGHGSRLYSSAMTTSSLSFGKLVVFYIPRS